MFIFLVLGCGSPPSGSDTAATRCEQQCYALSVSCGDEWSTRLADYGNDVAAADPYGACIAACADAADVNEWATCFEDDGWTEGGDACDQHIKNCGEMPCEEAGYICNQ